MRPFLWPHLTLCPRKQEPFKVTSEFGKKNQGWSHIWSLRRTVSWDHVAWMQDWTQLRVLCAVCLVTQLDPALCDPVDYIPPGSSVHGDSPGKSIGVGCHALLQGIFPTQGSNPGLPRWGQIPYHLSLQGRPRITGVGSLPLLQGNFLTQEPNQALLHCRGILSQLSSQGSVRVLQNLLRFGRWVWSSPVLLFFAN